MENLRPFDLSRALAGDPICYRNGKVPLEWHYFEKCKQTHSVATVDQSGDMHTHKENGFFLNSMHEHPIDIFMLPKKKTLWYCVWKNKNGVMGTTTPGSWKSAEEYLKEFPSETILAQHTIEVDDND